MRVLDIDLDYFLDSPVYEQDSSSDARVDDLACIESVWSEDRVRQFLEENLSLSKDRKIKGCVVKGHNESLEYWSTLVQQGKLIKPFSVVHVDSHADLGFTCLTLEFVLDSLIFMEERLRPCCCNDFEIDGRFYNIGIEDYLLFAIAFGWISDLTFCANPCADAGAIPSEIVIGGIPNCEITSPLSKLIQLKPRDKKDWGKTHEPKIPFRIIPTTEGVKYRSGDFDYVVLAQSPNYTPSNADYIIDVFREYIIEE